MSDAETGCVAARLARPPTQPRLRFPGCCCSCWRPSLRGAGGSWRWCSGSTNTSRTSSQPQRCGGPLHVCAQQGCVQQGCAQHPAPLPHRSPVVPAVLFATGSTSSWKEPSGGRGWAPHLRVSCRSGCAARHDGGPPSRSLCPCYADLPHKPCCTPCACRRCPWHVSTTTTCSSGEQAAAAAATAARDGGLVVATCPPAAGMKSPPHRSPCHFFQDASTTFVMVLPLPEDVGSGRAGGWRPAWKGAAAASMQ